MSRSQRLAACLALMSGLQIQAGVLPDKLGTLPAKPQSASPALSAELQKEFGVETVESAAYGAQTITAYKTKDTTGALAAWQWLRPADGKTCGLGSFCSQSATQLAVFDANYLLVFNGPRPKPADVSSFLKALPDQSRSSLPALLTFLPRQDLVPNSARYILGPDSLAVAAPELKPVNVGFEQGAEAQLADYKIGGQKVRLALFSYPTPSMARLRAVDFRLVPNTVVKRSAVLVAVILNPKNDEQAAALLSRIQYEAKITWNDAPPATNQEKEVKTLYSLLVNIIYLSVILSALCLAAGLIYAGMRLYRRRYGTLEADEAMTTLHLSGD